MIDDWWLMIDDDADWWLMIDADWWLMIDDDADWWLMIDDDADCTMTKAQETLEPSHRSPGNTRYTHTHTHTQK